jgi:hypothetical protein
MINCIDNTIAIPITPDPVLAFNYNMKELLPTKDEILNKFALPKDYVAISMFRQSLSQETLDHL